MKLYHFTAREHLSGIKTFGIVKGVIPTGLFYGFTWVGKIIPGYQWLTSNQSFKQSWCEHTRLKIDRTALRLTVEIPQEAEANLIKWVDGGLFLTTMYETSIAYGDPEHWYVYHGYIPSQWIKEVTPKILIAGAIK